MSRNEDRLGIPQEFQSNDDLPVAAVMQQPAAQSQPTSLEFVEVPDLVELPSKGRFYSENSVLRNKEIIEIRLMGTKQEDILSNKLYLRKGIALDRMLQSLIIDKSINVDDLLLCDKSALIIAARIGGYGPDYTADIRCSYCGKQKPFEFDLTKLKTVYANDSIVDENRLFTFTLPKTKAVVKCKLLTGHDEKYLSQLESSKKEKNLEETPITDTMVQYIVSINGETNKGKIVDFVRSRMPVIDSRYLRKEYNEQTPNVDLNYEFTCSDAECGAKEVISLPITREMFWHK